MSVALLIGLGCIGAPAPLYRQYEDEFPAQCAQIERVEDARKPIWSIIMVIDGRHWALETDMTLTECWLDKPKGATCESVRGY